MKILLSAYHNPCFFTISEYIENAIQALGHELIIFDDRQHIIPGRIRYRIKRLYEYDHRYINQQLITLAKKTIPDIAIITGGHRISSKTVQNLKSNGIVTVLWTTDPPINFQSIMDTAPHFDFIFCQGSEAVELLNNAGIRGPRWLPMACDPKVHHALNVTVEERRRWGSDLVFVGSYYANRHKVLSELIHFDLGIYGPGWNKLKKNDPLKKNIKGKEVMPSDWLKIYSSSKIVIVIHYQDGRIPCFQASPKVFESLACGAFVIVDRQKDIMELFREGKHLAVFNDSFDLKNQIEHYLSRPKERDHIARNGSKVVYKHHTYEQRISTLLEYIS